LQLFLQNFWQGMPSLTSLILTACFCMNTSLAATPTAELLVNQAYTDGGLIASATVCQTPKLTLNQLIYQQKKSALDTAKLHQLTFTAQEYDDYVVDGFQATMETMRPFLEQPTALEGICASIADKIAQKLQASASPP